MTIQEQINLGCISKQYRQNWCESSPAEFLKEYPLFKKPFNTIFNHFDNGRNSKVAILKSTINHKLYNILIYTEKHEYLMVVNNNYLCGSYSSRYHKPLEGWTRGSDLGDGECSQETLNYILLRMLGVESIKICNEPENDYNCHGCNETDIDENRKHTVSECILTLGLDIDNSYIVTIQEIDGVPCLCLHNRTEHDGVHWSSMDAESLHSAIPIDRIISLCSKRKYMLPDDSRNLLK